MTEGTVGVLAAATGLTIFGVSTGLDPATLIAGLAGGLWAQSYQKPATVLKRLALTSLSALLSGYLAPLFASVVVSSKFINAALTIEMLQLPSAVIIGLTAHRILGPALIRFVSKKAGEKLK